MNEDRFGAVGMMKCSLFLTCTNMTQFQKSTFKPKRILGNLPNPGFGNPTGYLVIFQILFRCQVFPPSGPHTIHTTVHGIWQFSSRPWLRTATLERGGFATSGAWPRGCVFLVAWYMMVYVYVNGGFV